MKPINLNQVLRDLEIKHIKEALYFTGNNTTQAADLLGLKRTALVMKLAAFDMSIPRQGWRLKMKEEIVRSPFVSCPNNVEDQL